MSDNTTTLQQLLDSGDYNRAVSALEKAVAGDPGNIELAFTLATVRARAGQLDLAIPGLEEIATKTNFLPAWINLGQLYRVSGKLEAAIHALEQANGLEPQNTTVLQALAEVYQHSSQLERSREYWKKLYLLQPDNFAARQGLLFTLMNYSPAEAVTHGEWCLTHKPNEPVLTLALAEANRNASRPERALPLFQELGANEAVLDQSLMGCLLCYIELGYHDKALSILDKIESRQSGLNIQQLLLKARVFHELGEQEKAFDLSEKLARDNPDNPEAQYGFMNMAPERVDSNLLEQAEILSERLKGNDLGRVCFGLASCFEKQKNLDKQFYWLDRGNKAISAIRFFDRASHDFRHSTIKSVCDVSWAKRFSNYSHLSPACRPILICGMPRSGTTLTELIMAGCQDIFPTGESRTFNFAIQALSDKKGESHLRKVLESTDSLDAAFFAERTIEALRSHDGCSKDVFTNKSMDTPFYIGLILAALPDTRIVHLQRHPLDLGFGCYKQMFTHGQAFSFDWDAIAYSIASFEALMSHWAEIYPDKILRIRYEDLVTKPVETSENLASHCGVQWEDSMLRFNESRSVVRTASINQVRQGLFTHSVERWRSLGDRLDPLKDALFRNGIDYREYLNESV